MGSSWIALTITILLTTTISIAAAKQLRISPIIGLLTGGVVLGFFLIPSADSRETLDLLAEIGISFLLFEVGSHLPINKLFSNWRGLLIHGPLQVVGSAALLAIPLSLLNFSPLAVGIVAIALSLSSTAVVVRLLQERGELATPSGDIVFSVLIFQDLLAVLLLALLPALGGNGDASAMGALMIIGRSLFFAALVLGMGYFAARPFFKWIVSQDIEELLTPSALLYVLTVAWLAHSLGLSYSLGAFLAGVSTAGTRYSAMVLTEIHPFRVLLLALFFLTTGLKLDTAVISSEYKIILLLSAMLVVLKFVGNFLGLWASGIPRSVSVRIASVLAQASEFSLLLSLMLSRLGMLTEAEAVIMQTTIVISLVLAPLAAYCGCAFSTVCSRGRIEDEAEPVDHDPSEVVIVEFDAVAWELATALQRENIPYRGHERNQESLAEALSRGFNVYFSNVDRPRTISRAVMGKVSVLVSLVEDDEILELLIGAMQQYSPQTPIIAATRDLARFERLSSRNLKAVFLKNEKTAGLILAEVLLLLCKEDCSESAMERAEELKQCPYSRGELGAEELPVIPAEPGLAAAH